MNWRQDLQQCPRYKPDQDKKHARDPLKRAQSGSYKQTAQKMHGWLLSDVWGPGGIASVSPSFSSVQTERGQRCPHDQAVMQVAGKADCSKRRAGTPEGVPSIFTLLLFLAFAPPHMERGFLAVGV